ncbi:RipA family octameric membrane protein [Micromonospora sp. bgisy143]|uniref:RipA family octameric membrane protein n=1 Tax=Micromonospora sp. bgisy143 TaxID=3413790 RepID=UPI003EB9F1B5
MEPRTEDRIWTHRQNLNTDFNAFSNYFLLAQSILLAMVGTGISGKQHSPVFLPLTALGFLLTATWAYVLAKQKFVLDQAKARCSELFKDYRDLRAQRSDRRWLFSNTAILAYLIPGTFAFAWIMMGIAQL